MYFTPTSWKLLFCLTELNCGTDSNWMSTEITSHLHGHEALSSMDVPLCVCSVTLGHLLPVCAHLLWCRQQRVNVLHPLIGCHQDSYVFSSGFLKTQVYGFYSITAFTNVIDKRIIFESTIVLMLKWIFVSGQEGKKITLMLSLFLYQSSLEL